MTHLRGPSRSEVQLLPPCLDDFVPANAPVRFVEAYVEGLDLAELGFARVTPHATGRPPYHPADLLKLYLYGYLHRIRSSRRLEAEAQRNLELMWLLRSVRPDFKTIADFRKDNVEAFKGLFKQFNLLCRRLGLFSAELVAIDGSKFTAVNSPRRNFTQAQLAELIRTIEARIDSYLSVMESKDAEAEGSAPAPSAQALQEKINHLKEQKGAYDHLLGELREAGQTQVSLTDADARNMKGPHGHVVGYNVQVAVDSKHDLIVVEDVVQNGTDFQQLGAMALAAQEQLAAEQLQIVADKGYHRADELAACEKAGIEPIVPAHQTTSGKTAKGQSVFPKQDFHYDPEKNVYHCPGGQTLAAHQRRTSRGLEGVLYYNRSACRNCALKTQCTTAPYRTITRWANEEAAERTLQRVLANPQVISRRKEMVEHVFGTMRNWGHDKFLLRGLRKVRAEFSLSALTYNLRRVLNLLSCEDLIQALQNPSASSSAAL
jgi:transposase